MRDRPDVSAVVVSFNTRELTLRAVGSLFAQVSVSLEVWVVDNASVDGSAAAVRAAFPRAHVLALGENVGFGAGNNRALSVARGRHVCLLNSDAELRRRDDLRRLVDALDQHTAVGVIGPRLESPGGHLEFSARRFPTLREEVMRRCGLHHFVPANKKAGLFLLEFFRHDRAMDVDWLTGACLLVRRELFSEVGLFDPEMFMYGEEREWQLRVRTAGWRVRFEPSVTVSHARAASSRGNPEWRVMAALRADLQFVVMRKGLWYGFVFGCVRTVGLALEWTHLAMRSWTSSALRVRTRAVALELRLWTRLLLARDIWVRGQVSEKAGPRRL